MRRVHCKKEKFDVYIGRPSMWGNPYSSKEDTLARYKVDTVDEAVAKHKEFLDWQLKTGKIMEYELLDLDGKILGCWCQNDRPCHGDNIINKIKELKNDKQL